MNSTKKPRRKLPDWCVWRVPRKHPLTPHAKGWVKWITNRGVVWVCGKVSPEEAAERWEQRKDELTRGAAPSPRAASGLTVKELVNEFMARQLRRMEGGGKLKPLKPRTFEDYRQSLSAFAEHVGPRRLVSELGPDDFTAYLGSIPGESPYTVSRHVAYVAAMFNWAEDADRVPPRSVRFGPDFVKPSRAAHRAAKAGKPHKSYTSDEVLWLLLAAPPSLEPLVLLGINAGMSAADIGEMPRDAVDLAAGTIEYARAKVLGSFRKAKLWPETIDALREYRRPKPAAPEYAGLFFLTRHGLPWQRERRSTGKRGEPKITPINALSAEFGGLVESCGIPKHDGRGYSGLRTTFATVADTSGDERARDTVMGHRSRHYAHISAEYVEVPMERVERVCEHVRSWLFHPTKS